MSRAHIQNQKSYADDTIAVRARFGSEFDKAKSYYQMYVDFVLKYSNQPNPKILEVGCGSGWSTLMLKQAGADVMGLDLYPGPPEAAMVDHALKYQQGDSQALPFGDELFDVVAMHDVLEHTPDPSKVLNEAFRVLRSGGRLIVTGPNVLSVFAVAYFTLQTTVSKLMRGQFLIRRKPNMPRHPGGNTTPEGAYYSLHHLFLTLKKLFIDRKPEFTMRVPDPNPPFFADNDACYYSNPMDLRNWARSRPDARLIKWYSEHRRFAKYFWPVLSGTWIVIEKR